MTDKPVAQTWIPVNERLPEPGMLIEVWFSQGEPLIGKLNEERTCWMVDDGEYFYWLKHSTHWRYIVGPVALEGKVDG